MTLIIGARCVDGVVLAADRRRVARYEKGPDAIKLFRLPLGAVLAGAGDDAVLSEARIFIERRLEETRSQSPGMKLFDIVEVTAAVVNELVSLYHDRAEEPFGFAMAGLESIGSGKAKLYTIFSAGLSDVPWVCLGSGSSYARPLLELLLADGDLPVDDGAKTMPALFSLVANVLTTVGNGVDICAVRDNEGPGNITHEKEVSLDGLRSAILDALIAKH